MQHMQRRETRYFFSTIRLLEVIYVVRSIFGQEIYYDNPVTETTYFTLGKKANFAFPKNLRVRARRYISELTPRVVLAHSSVFLEIKEEVEGGTNRKKRIQGDTLEVVEMLRSSNGPDGLPSLFTYAATQSLRFHWNIGASSRLTLDADIRLFGFQENIPLEAEHVSDFGEGKLEFKLEDESLLAHEVSVVERAQCARQEYTYLERKTRKCMKEWLETKEA